MLCFRDSIRFTTLYRGGSCAICTGQASHIAIHFPIRPGEKVSSGHGFLDTLAPQASYCVELDHKKLLYSVHDNTNYL